jgi:cytochrome o ubiquinol oxidase subunit 2
MKACNSIVVGLFALLLNGCSFDFSSMDFAVLNPMGEIAIQQKTLLGWAVFLMLLVIIPVFIMVPLFAWKYREKNKGSKYSPEWGHSTLLEVIWWGVPFIIIVILGTITWISSHKLDPYRPIVSENRPIRIQVIALNWKWLFIYPEYNIATVNFIQFPVDVPLNLELTSDAPMNSLAIPQLGGQIYAMQGMTTKLHLIAEKEGEFKGYSANYSGSGFSGMRFTAKASSIQEFNDWLKTARKSGISLTLSQYEKLSAPSQNNLPEYFSSVDAELFEMVLSKTMSHSHGGHEPSNVPGKEVGQTTKNAVIYEQIPDKKQYNDFPSNVKAGDSKKFVVSKKDSVNADNSAPSKPNSSSKHDNH